MRKSMARFLGLIGLASVAGTNHPEIHEIRRDSQDLERPKFHDRMQHGYSLKSRRRSGLNQRQRRLAERRNPSLRKK